MSVVRTGFFHSEVGLLYREHGAQESADGSRLLTDAGGAMVVVVKGGVPPEQQTWEIHNVDDGLKAA